MSDRSDIEDQIIDTIHPGSMAISTIVDELNSEYSRKEIKLALVDMIQDERIEEHPDFDGAYRVPSQTV